MKTYEDCATWTQNVREWLRKTPEGCAGVGNSNGHERTFALQGVNPAAISMLATEHAAPYICEYLEDGETIDYCYTDIINTYYPDHFAISFRFFYRKPVVLA